MLVSKIKDIRKVPLRDVVESNKKVVESNKKVVESNKKVVESNKKNVVGAFNSSI